MKFELESIIFKNSCDTGKIENLDCKQRKELIQTMNWRINHGKSERKDRPN